MRTIPFSRILKRVAALMGVLTDELTTEEWTKLCAFSNERLAQAWHVEAWPLLSRVELRCFRDPWDETVAYGTGDEVWYSQTQKYYQAVQGHTGEAPADGNGVVSSQFWSEASTTYSGDDWEDSHAYAIGDIVYYPPTLNFYQCHTAHTSSSSLTPDATGVDKRWGMLSPFLRTIDLDQTGQTAIGLVLAVFAVNPQVYQTAEQIDWELLPDGILVRAGNYAWIKFLSRSAISIGDVWDPTATYAIGETVYFEAEDATSDFYTAIAETEEGESPGTTPANWAKQEIPEFLGEYLGLGMYADWLTMDGQHEKATNWEKLTQGALARELDKIQGLQGQIPRLNWRTK